MEEMGVRFGLPSFSFSFSSSFSFSAVPGLGSLVLGLGSLVFGLWSLLAASAGPAVEKVGDSVVDPAALTIQGSFGPAINGKSFQQDAVTTHAGWQYLVYYDADRRLCIGRRKLPDGAWQKLRFEDYDFKSNDAHNVATIGICAKDGTIHIAWDHHGGPLHYRMSRKGVATEPDKVAWEPALFGPVTAELEKGVRVPSVTYPRFIRTPEGGLQLCYRRGGSGNGDRLLVDYNPETGSWEKTRAIDSRKGSFADEYGSSTSRCSYPNGYTYDARGRLHVTWVWRETSQGANHDILYAYSDDRGFTWRSAGGEVIGEAAPGGKVVALDSPGILAVKIPRVCGLMNTQAQAADSRGRIHTVMYYADEAAARAAAGKARWGPPSARRYHHYWLDDAGAWQHRELPGPIGTRPKLFFDRKDNAVLIFNRAGNLVLMGATAAGAWNDWREIHTETGSFVNEMLGDPHRWQKEGILSVLVQGKPATPHDPTPLRVVDFRVRGE